MSTDVQHFTEDGTWVKPPGAVRVEVTLKGGDGGASTAYVRGGRYGGATGGTDVAVAGHVRAPWLDKPGTEGATVTRSFAADDLPALMPVTVGQPGGFASVITHLREPDDEKIRAYGRGEIKGGGLTGEELEMATDGLDALGWDDGGTDE